MLRNSVNNLVVILSLVLVFTPSLKSQIVSNGDLEMGQTGLNNLPSGWNVISGTPDYCDSSPTTCLTLTYKIQNASPQGGRWIRFFNGELLAGLNNEIFGQPLTSTLAAGQEYRITFYAAYSRINDNVNATTASIVFGFSSGPPTAAVGANNQDVVALTTPEEWVLHSFNFIPATNLNYLTFGKEQEDVLNACYIDDVFIEPVCQVDLGPDTTLCDGVVYTLDATKNNGEYLWQDGSTGATFNVTEPGTYWVEQTANLCTSRDTVVIDFKPTPSIDIENEVNTCIGETYTIDASLANATYLWQDNSTDPTFEVTTEGFYEVEVTVNGCRITENVEVIFNSPPEVDLGEDVTICEGDFLNLKPNIPDATYLWHDNSTKSNFIAAREGSYWVEVNQYDCLVRDTINVTLTDVYCDCFLAFPNVFSPNFDGINDTFEVFDTCPLIEFNYTILNRWGGVVFESDTQGVFWDGQIKGQPADSGVYIYVVTYQFFNSSEKQTTSGSFTLLK